MHRLVLLLSLVANVALSATPKPVVAVLPLKATPDTVRLGLLMEARTTALLSTSTYFTVLDLKQVLAMAAQEGLDPSKLGDDLPRARALLGADLVVTASLSGGTTGFTLVGTLNDAAKSTPFTAKVAGNWSAALTQGSDALAKAVLTHEGQTLPPDTHAQPESTVDGAVTALGVCWELALKQPMGIDAPVGLSGDELANAITACKVSFKVDPSLRFSAATLALLKAIARDDAEAQRLLGPDADDDPALVPWMLARFWLASRHQSTAAAVAFLGRVKAQHPNVLLVRSLEANALASMNEHARATAAWAAYLELSPSSAFAQGRLSRSLARQAQLPAALEAATKGLALAPQSREARLTLANRQLDASKVDEARATLAPLVALPDAPAEACLHLGLALIAAGDAASARPLLERATTATGPRAWRTKGRAFAQLAQLELKANQFEAAKLAWASAVEAGVSSSPPDPRLAVVRDAGTDAPARAGGLYISLVPLESTWAAARQAVDEAAHDRLAALGASFAPAKENAVTAVGAIKAGGLKGYALRFEVTKAADDTMKVNLLVLSYPEQALKGTWSMRAKKSDAALKSLTLRVIDEAAGDLEWK